MASNQLQQEYKALLEKYGLKSDTEKFGQEQLRRFFLSDWANEVQVNNKLPDSLGNEAQAKFDQALHNALHNYKNNYINLLDEQVTELSAEVERDIKSANQTLTHQIFAAEFPTGSFNAQVVPSESGLLVLINNGLMMFIYQTLKVMVYSAFDERLAFESNRDSSKWANSALAEIILAYLIFRDPRFAKRLPAPGGLKAMLIGDFVNPCEKFAVAHEYGHILGNHLELASKFALSTSVGDLEAIQKNWLQEYEADVIGASIMLQSAPKPINDDNDFMALKFIVGGPLIFFTLDNLITQSISQLRKNVKFNAITDHPPSHLRIENLKNFFEKVTHTTEVFRVYEDFVTWLSVRESDVLKLIDDFATGRPQGSLVRLAKLLEILNTP
jgi:hypothetical protein